MNDIAELIEAASADGVEVFLRGDEVRVRGTGDALSHWRPALRPHRDALREALRLADQAIRRVAHFPPGWVSFNTVTGMENASPSTVEKFRQASAGLDALARKEAGNAAD